MKGSVAAVMGNFVSVGLVVLMMFASLPARGLRGVTWERWGFVLAKVRTRLNGILVPFQPSLLTEAWWVSRAVWEQLLSTGRCLSVKKSKSMEAYKRLEELLLQIFQAIVLWKIVRRRGWSLKQEAVLRSLCVNFVPFFVNNFVDECYHMEL